MNPNELSFWENDDIIWGVDWEELMRNVREEYAHGIAYFQNLERIRKIAESN